MSRPSFPPASVLPGFAFPTVGPLGLGSPPSQSALFHTDHRYYAPLRLPALLLPALHSSLRAVIPCLLPPALCSRLARLAARRGSLRSAPGLFYPADLHSGLHARKKLALPSSRATPWCMPCSRTPVVLPILALAHRKLLPSLIGERVDFPTLPLVVIPNGPQRSSISGLYHTACLLATPSFVPTITGDARGFASELLARLCSGGSRC